MDKSNYHYLAIASMVVGIINLCAWLLPICGGPLAIGGIALGVVGRNSSQRNLALIGIGLCCFGLLLSIGNALYGAYLGATGQIF